MSDSVWPLNSACWRNVKWTEEEEGVGKSHARNGCFTCVILLNSYNIFSHYVWLWCVILFIYCWICFANIVLKISTSMVHQRYWPGIFISVVSLTGFGIRLKWTCRMRYHLTPIRMSIIKKSTNNKCRRKCGEKGTLVHRWYKCKLGHSLWKTVWKFLKILKTELLFGPAIPLLGIYLEKKWVH